MWCVVCLQTAAESPDLNSLSGTLFKRLQTVKKQLSALNNNNNNDSENNNSSGVPPLGNGRAPTDVDFDTALFACWKKLRALFVAADKSRSGRLPQKKVVAILQRNHVGSSRDEALSKTKPHLEGGGVNYNAFIKQVLQSRSR